MSDISECRKVIIRNELRQMEWLSLTEFEIEQLTDNIYDSEDFEQDLAYITEQAAVFWMKELKMGDEEE